MWKSLRYQGTGGRGSCNLPLVSREWKNGSSSSYNCTPFLHSLLTKGKAIPAKPQTLNGIDLAWLLRE